MRSGKKRNRERYFMAAIMLGIPLVLAACTGNILKGEKISLFGPNSRKANDAPAAPAGQAPGQTTGNPQPGASAKPPCVVDLSGTAGNISPRDKDVMDFNAAVEAIENPPGKPQPEVKDLLEQIKTFINQEAKLELTSAQMEQLVDGILSVSDLSAATHSDLAAQPGILPDSPQYPSSPDPAAPASSAAAGPAPAPNAKSTLTGVVAAPPTGEGLPEPKPVAQGVEGGAGGSSNKLPETSSTDAGTTPAATTPPSAEYFLHPSIVAFVAYKTTINFAQGSGEGHIGLGDKPEEKQEIIELGQSIIKLGNHSQGIIVYKKAYIQAIKELKGYKDQAVRKLLKKVMFDWPGGVGLKAALHWVQEYEKWIAVGQTAGIALEKANGDLCYTPNPEKPEEGFHGTIPSVNPPAPGSKPPKPNKPNKPKP